MKKEEFPTFLNEQPTVIFGRTARELLFIACGVVGGWMFWVNIQQWLPNAAGLTLALIFSPIIVISFVVVALVKVGHRTLEEWFAAWLLFISTPKIYIYKQIEEDSQVSMGEIDEIDQKNIRNDDDEDDHTEIE